MLANFLKLYSLLSLSPPHPPPAPATCPHALALTLAIFCSPLSGRSGKIYVTFASVAASLTTAHRQ